MRQRIIPFEGPPTETAWVITSRDGDGYGPPVAICSTRATAEAYIRAHVPDYGVAVELPVNTSCK